MSLEGSIEGIENLDGWGVLVWAFVQSNHVVTIANDMLAICLQYLTTRLRYIVKGHFRLTIIKRKRVDIWHQSDSEKTFPFRLANTVNYMNSLAIPPSTTQRLTHRVNMLASLPLRYRERLPCPRSALSVR